MAYCLSMITPSAVPDPTVLYRLRDGIYAADLLIAAVSELDFFTWLDRRGPLRAAELIDELELAERPTDVLLTYCAALGLLDRDVADGDRIEISELARQHLVANSAYDLRSYYVSLAERPAVSELARVLRTDEQAPWASARPPDLPSGSPPAREAQLDWSNRLADVDFARRITAAMDTRAAFLGSALAVAIADIPISLLLDIGGASGSYAAAMLAGRRDARAAVFERAPVDEVSRTLLHERRVERADLSDHRRHVHRFASWRLRRAPVFARAPRLGCQASRTVAGGIFCGASGRGMADRSRHPHQRRQARPLAYCGVLGTADALNAGKMLVDSRTRRRCQPSRVRRHHPTANCR